MTARKVRASTASARRPTPRKASSAKAMDALGKATSDVDLISDGSVGGSSPPSSPTAGRMKQPLSSVSRIGKRNRSNNDFNQATNNGGVVLNKSQKKPRLSAITKPKMDVPVTVKKPMQYAVVVDILKVEISDKRLDSEDERLLEDDLSEYSFKQRILMLKASKRTELDRNVDRITPVNVIDDEGNFQSKSHKRLAPVGSHVQGHSDTDSDIDVDMASTEIIGDKPDLRDMVTDCDNDDESPSAVNGPMYASPGMFKVVSKKKALHIEDYNPSKALPKGTTCHILKLFYKAEVEHGRGSYIDPILRKGYKTLPGLTIRQFVTFRGEDGGSALVMASQWLLRFPKLSKEWLVGAIEFNRDGIFANPARIDPAGYHTVRSGANGLRVCGVLSSSPTLFLSLIFVTSCNIAIPAVTNNGIIMKDISGLHHSLDWDRMQSCICTIFDMDSMQAPINEGQLTISTRPPARNVASPSKSISGNTLVSPVKGALLDRIVESGRARPWVTHVDSVPVWDARNPIRSVGSGSAEASTSDKNVTPPFAFNKKDLSTFHSKLHKYPDGEEVPNGSLALVAYTLGSYERDGVTILTPNLNWVVVIAADD